MSRVIFSFQNRAQLRRCPAADFRHGDLIFFFLLQQFQKSSFDFQKEEVPYSLLCVALLLFLFLCSLSFLHFRLKC